MAYLWAALLVLLVMTAFALGNRDLVSVRFLWWTVYEGTVGVAMVGAAVAGAFLVLLASTIRQRHLGRRVNRAERRVQELERQLLAGGQTQARPQPLPDATDVIRP